MSPVVVQDIYEDVPDSDEEGIYEYVPDIDAEGNYEYVPDGDLDGNYEDVDDLHRDPRYVNIISNFFKSQTAHYSVRHNGVHKNYFQPTGYGRYCKCQRRGML